MSWISGLVGAAGGFLTSKGKAREQRKSNQFFQNLYSPGNINSYAGQYNPWLFSALGSTAPQGGWGRLYGNPDPGFMGDLRKIIGGQDISPYLLNQPLNQINQGANQNLARFQALVGRNNAGGGLANAYGLANLGGRNIAISNLYNQYGQWREAQRRSDLDWIFRQIANAQGMGFNSAQGIASKWATPPNLMTTFGNAALGFAAGAGMGGFGGIGGAGAAAQPAAASGGATPAWTNFTNQGNANQWYSWR